MSTDSSLRARLFLGSCLALITTSMSFAIRADIMGPLGEQFALNNEMVGVFTSTAFWGFALSMLIGGPLCDWLGMGRILTLAFLGHLAGILVTIFAQGFWTLFAGTLLIGMANGCVEAACNPLVAAIYPDDKTKKLNQFHVWFPGGIVIGGLVAFALTKLNVGWQVKMATMLVPLLVYGFLFLGKKFPETERKAAGISTGEMVKSVFSPLFLVMLVCMGLTASTELPANQWIPNILTKSADVSGILVLVWISGLMAVGRQFAGPIVHKLSPTGMLLFSAFFSGIGLVALSFAKGPLFAFSAATVFAIGVCYFWPTMLGFVAERCPRSGALGLALMGCSGMLVSSKVVPVMGHIYDTQGGDVALRAVALLPVVLLVVFGILFFLDRKSGGYRAEKLARH